MTSERSRKDLALEHFRRLNAGDVDGLLELYADDVVFEDPVGGDRGAGRASLRAHFAEYVAANLHEDPGEPVAGQDGAHVVVPVSAVMDYQPKGPAFAERGWLVPPAAPEGRRLERHSMVMLRMDATGLIRELKAFWGRSDLTVTS
ncbi:nuclear transport factor 2 family protein [Actinomadura macra]|uniref:nuclear transport factor 2 family protein n=1 Tax=Actinomadura macra TaxID=46164 RepID=UPI00083626E4|nr:nuclear transport factor 2 family protein [Actinomadura macra]